ncbi:hypothetical protein BN971_04463 [Mycobacterium bohemicum DSM 44277]|nr:hypothetical protein BN971_04463 [Mycobacterium bohemicum DSM 44277]
MLLYGVTLDKGEIAAYPCCMASIKRGHHTVPRFYLDGFANDDRQLGVAQLSSKKRFPSSTGDATVFRDFYNIDSRADPNAVEDLLSEIEGDAAAVFRNVLVDRCWPLGIEQRAMLATFLALQRTRTPSHRQMVDEIKEIMADVLESTGRGDAVIPVGLDQVDSKTVHIQSMLDIEQHAPCYFGRRWWLVQFGRKRLLTSDSPVGLLPHPDAPADAALGVGTAWVILFPMSPTVGLMMVAPDREDEPIDIARGRADGILDGSTYLAKLFNETAIDNARESIFHHPDDGNLVPADLPSPRGRQLETSPGPPE